MKTSIIVAACVDIILLFIVARFVFLADLGYLVYAYGIWFPIITIADVLLIIGAFTKNRTLMKGWTSIAILHILLLSIYLTLEGSMAKTGEIVGHPGCKKFFHADTIVAMCYSGIAVCCYNYFWIVVKRHLKNIAREKGK